MNKIILLTLFGFVIGIIIMFLTSNIVCFHGANSKDVKNTIIKKDNKLYRFVPIIDENVIKNEK